MNPEPTLFSFPSHHHPLSPSSPSSMYSTSFITPTGLHPSLQLHFTSFASPPNPTCALHTYLTLPSFVFPDRYQLSSPNLLRSKNLRSIRSLLGETDLEAPDWIIKRWGSSMLLELAPPARTPGSPNGAWTADVPLHLRYLQTHNGGQRKMSLPWPVVFWACPAEEGTKMNTNPFDRTHLGYESLFGPRTMFYHLLPQPTTTQDNLLVELQVPVLNDNRTAHIEDGTVAVVLFGTLWLVVKLLQVFVKDHVRRQGKGIDRVVTKAKAS